MKITELRCITVDEQGLIEFESAMPRQYMAENIQDIQGQITKVEPLTGWGKWTHMIEVSGDGWHTFAAVIEGEADSCS